MTVSASASPDGSRIWITATLAAALLLRLAWVLHLPSEGASVDALPDQREYLELARNLLAGRGLVFHDVRFGADLFAYRTPGYPFFLAACGASIRSARVAQAVLDTSTVLAIFLLARRWLSTRASLIAAGIVAINPLSIFFTGLLLSETLFTALLVWGMTLLAWRQRPGFVTLLAACPILAFAVLVRPSMLLLPILLGGASGTLNSGSGGAYRLIRTMVLPAAVAAICTVAMLLPWACRNRQLPEIGRWVWTTTNSGITLYDGFNPTADGGSDQRFVSRMPELQTMSELDRSAYLARMARQFIADHPSSVIFLTIRKIARTWSPVPLGSDYGKDWRYVAVGLMYTLPLFVLTMLGLSRSPGTPGEGDFEGRKPFYAPNHPHPDPLPGYRERESGAFAQAAKVFLLLPAIYITVVHGFSVGSLRYRAPADVPMALIAAVALSRCPLTGTRHRAALDH